MLFRGLFIASSPKFYFGKPDWYTEGLGTVDRQYLAYNSEPETPSFPLGPPPPHGTL
jgi:hypothetical protein